AAAGNGKGIVGVASNVNVKIMVLKVNGGMKSEGSAANAVKAIKYAEAMGAKVVNMSWGTYSFDHSLYDAMSRSSMLFVCAAGNDGGDNDRNPMYPASYDLDNVLSVTYIDSQGRFDLSKVTNGGGNYGLKTVDIAAPGKDILSTVTGGYAYKSGTSMAAPFVTGVAALCYAFDNSFDALTVKRLILSNTKSLSSLSGKIAVPGIPDVYALAKALSTHVYDENAPRIEISQKIENGKTTVTINAFDEGTGVKLIKYAPSTVSRDFFENDGTVIANGEALKLTDGYYTFYAEDYVGNTVIKSVFVGEDRMNPVLKTAFSTTDDYKSYVIDVTASDAESGIKVVRYMSGNVQRDKIKTDGKELKLSDGAASFTADIKTDTVTVYAEDNYGNGTVEVVRLKYQKATGLMLSMTEGHISRSGNYELKAFVLSAGSTDKVRFESSDPKIATVSADGVIKGVAKGKCTITVTTQSGITATCVIHVD
ncbi:MAG: S8 family serine peptidase, partial [Lachnospiraceae bacterium]|nr:S8 family serine peptidase [Lachnospiraceae bacterium]